MAGLFRRPPQPQQRRRRVKPAAAAAAAVTVSFRLRNDDGNETAATWVAAQNTNASITEGVTFRLRYLVQETGGVAINGTDSDWGLYFRINAGAYQWLGAESITGLNFSTSPNVTDVQATTQQLTGGTGSFIAGQVEEGNGRLQSAIGASQNTEYEFVLILPAADVVGGDTLDVQLAQWPVTYGGPANRIAVTGTFPTITVAASGPTTQTGSFSLNAVVRKTMTGGYVNAVAADNPIAWYRLGEASGSVIDSVPGGSSGTAAGGVTRDVTGALLSGDDGAVTFNGTTGYITVPDQDKLDLADGPLTVECWIKCATADTNERTPLSKSAGGGSSGGFELTLRPSNGSSPGAIGWRAARFGWVSNSGTTRVDDGAWHHVVATKNGSSNFVYVDGVDRTNPDTGVTFSNSDQPLGIGGQWYGGAIQTAQLWNGSVDEVAIYGTVLSATRALAHYQGLSTGFGFTLNAQIPATFTLNAVILKTQGPSEYSTGVLANSPVAYYRLGEASGSVIDSTGGTSGSTVGTVTRDVTGALLSGDDGAIDFNGTNGGVNVPDQTKLDLGSGPWTLECWVNLDAHKDTNTILGKESGAYQISFDSVGSVALVKAGTLVDFFAGTITAGTWHHIVWTRTGSSNAQNQLYVDGVARTLTGSGGTTYTDNSQPFHIGYEGPDGEFTDGKLDEVAIYNTALTAAAIRSHFFSGVEAQKTLTLNAEKAAAGGTVSSSFTVNAVILRHFGGDSYNKVVRADSPKAYWRLGEASGTTALDEQGLINGTYNGSPTLGVVGPLVGDPNTAVAFGTSKSVTVTFVAGLAVGDVFSAECWFRVTGGSGTNRKLIQHGSGNGWLIAMRTDNTVQVGMDANPFWAESSIAITDSNWHHVVAVKSGQSIRKIYIDGADVTVLTGTVTHTNASGALAIGSGSGEYFPGEIDEVAVYGTALSYLRAQAHYVASSAPALTFTVDAVIKRTQTGSFSLDAVVKRTITGTAFTLDALVKKTQSNSFTVNALVKRTQTGTLTLDAVIKRSQTGTFTVNAVLKRTLAGAFTVDALIKKTQAGSFSLNAVIRRPGIAGAFTVDAIVKKSQTGSFTVNALIKRTQSGSFLLDALIKRTQAGTFTLDAVLKRTQSGSFVLDAVIKRSQTGSFTVNALLKRTQPGTFTLDALVLAHSATKTFTVDAVIKRAISGAFTADALIKRTQSGSFTLDAAIRRTQTAAFTVNAVIKKSQAGSFVLDALLKKTQSSSFTADAVINRTSTTKTFTLDAWLIRHTDAAFTVNAVQRKTQTGSFLLDAFIPGQGIAAFVVDAVIRKSQSGTFTLNALVKRTTAASFTLNAVLLRTQTGSFSVNAVLRKSAAGNFTLDAVVRRTVAATGSLDAVIRRSSQASLTTDAIVKASRSAAFSLDALIKKSQAGTFTLNAWLVKTTAGTFTANAVIRRTQTSSFTLDAFIPGTGVGAFTVDAVVKRSAAGTFTVNALIKRTQTGSFLANALIKATRTGSFTLNASIPGAGTGAFTLDAVIKRAASGSFAVNAVKRTTSTGSFTASALVKRTAAGTFLADAVLRKSQAGAFTVNAEKALLTTAKSFALNAVVRRTASATVSLDGVLSRASSGAFALDAVKLKTGLAGLTADAVVRATRMGGFATNAVLLSPRSASFPVRAIIRRTQLRTTTLNAEIVSLRRFTLNAWIQGFGENDFQVDANISGRIAQEIAASVSARTIAGSLSAATIGATVGGTTIAGSIAAETIEGTTSAKTIGATVYTSYHPTREADFALDAEVA
jgi:hypothetical protein